MTAPPTVSVVLPTYSRAHMVRRALHSALWQTFADLEVIVVDDASQDETAEVVGGIADPRVRYVRHETNRGLAAARNTGIAHAKGTYIAFLDDDDLWLPDKIEKQLRCFAESGPEVGAVHCGFLRWRTEPPYEAFVPAGPWTLRGDIVIKLLAGEGYVLPSTLMIGASVTSNVGCFDEKFRREEDSDFNLRIAKQYHFGFVPENLVIYFDAPGTLVKNRELVLDMGRRFVEKHEDSYRMYPAAYAQRLAWLSGQYHMRGDLETARMLADRALSIDPKNVAAREVSWSLRYGPLWSLARQVKAVARAAAHRLRRGDVAQAERRRS